MEKNIYIQLLEEGTKVYRPVPGVKIESNIYKVQGFEMYGLENEVWKFPPGTYVLVEEQDFGGEKILVAVKEQNPES
jgi:hypothetical protein